MSRVPWQSRIFDVDPGSFNNYENVLFFGYFLFFVKFFVLRPPFFIAEIERTNLPLSACENRMSCKIPVQEIMSPERPWLTQFLRFVAILNEPYLKKYKSDEIDFLDIERDTWGLLTLEIWATELQWFMKYACLGFCTFWMIQNEIWSLSLVWSTRSTWYCIWWKY